MFTTADISAVLLSVRSTTSTGGPSSLTTSAPSNNVNQSSSLSNQSLDSRVSDDAVGFPSDDEDLLDVTFHSEVVPISAQPVEEGYGGEDKTVC